MYVMVEIVSRNFLMLILINNLVFALFRKVTKKNFWKEKTSFT